MGIFGRLGRRRQRKDTFFCDVGVPDLSEPEPVQLHVLDFSTHKTYNDVIDVEVRAPGDAPYAATLRSGTTPSSASGLVIGFEAPGRIARADRARILLLEPPGGHDLPTVDAALQAVRDARDLRTAELSHRYPAPSTAELFERMSPTASATHPLWDALRFRMSLMTTAEARAVLDRIRAHGTTWQELQIALNPAWELGDMDVFTVQARCLQHLSNVAPGGGSLDEQPLMSIGLGVLLRELRPHQVDPDLYAPFVQPFVDVCGEIHGPA
jgi:hypothetical protein